MYYVAVSRNRRGMKRIRLKEKRFPFRSKVNPFTRMGLVLLLCALSSCSKKESTLTPSEILDAGWNDYRMGEYARAILEFDAVLANPGTNANLSLNALYGLATTWNLRRPGEDPERAAQLYRQIIDTAPTNDLAAWSLLGLARMQHLVPVGKEPDTKAVFQAYQDVIDRYPGHLAAKEAFIYQMAMLVATLKPEQTREAVRQLEVFVRQGSGEFVSPAWSLLAIAYTTLKEPEKRLEAEIKGFETTEIDPTNPFNEFAWAYWNIATVAEFEVGDFDTARTYYRRLIAEYPRDIRVFGARKALERMDAMEAKLRAGGAN